MLLPPFSTSRPVLPGVLRIKGGRASPTAVLMEGSESFQCSDTRTVGELHGQLPLLRPLRDLALAHAFSTLRRSASPFICVRMFLEDAQTREWADPPLLYPDS